MRNTQEAIIFHVIRQLVFIHSALAFSVGGSYNRQCPTAIYTMISPQLSPLSEHKLKHPDSYRAQLPCKNSFNDVLMMTSKCWCIHLSS